MTEPSSDARPQKVARAVRDGFIRWLTKPITLNEVLGFAICWAAMTVIYTVASTRG